MTEYLDSSYHRWRSTWPVRSVLAAVPHAALDEWVARGHSRRFAADEVLIEENSPASAVFLLFSGLVKVVGRASDATEVLLAVRMGGNMVGELGALDGGRRTATVTACNREPLLACEVPTADFAAVLNDHPRALAAVAASVSRKLRTATRRRTDMPADPMVRLARVLFELVEDHGQRLTENSALIAVDLTQPELGSLVGVSEATAHRALRELRRRRILEGKGRRLVIRDVAALRGVAALHKDADGTA